MANTYSLIASYTVGSGGASSITFSSIPSTYTDLIVTGSVRDNANDYLAMQFNNNTSNYTCKFFRGNGSNIASGTVSSSCLIGIDSWTSDTANSFGTFTARIFNYTATPYKGVFAEGVSVTNGSSQYTGVFASSWNDSTAINSIKIYGANAGTIFQQYTTAYLYGIKNS